MDERTAMDALKAAVQDKLVDDESRAYCSDHTLRRYLIARNWKVDKAAKLLSGTLEWRKSFAVDKITAADAKPNDLKGKLFIHGTDKMGRPAFFMRPSQEETQNDHDNNMKCLVYHLERAVSYLDEDAGIGKMVVVLDCDKYSNSNAPPWRTSRATLTILQDNYPERLGKFYVLSAPWYFITFYKAISPFIDKVTKEKIEFISGKNAEEMRENLSKYFDMSKFPEFLFGDYPANEVFQVDTYFTKEGEEKGHELVRSMRESIKAGAAAS